MLYKVNDLFYECKTGNWRDGFTHRVRILNKFGEQLLASTTRYYNRTWEKYHYQAAMRQAQESFERKINRAKAGKVFMNYYWENWEKYDFEQEPAPATLQ